MDCIKHTIDIFSFNENSTPATGGGNNGNKGRTELKSCIFSLLMESCAVYLIYTNERRGGSRFQTVWKSTLNAKCVLKKKCLESDKLEAGMVICYGRRGSVSG